MFGRGKLGTTGIGPPSVMNRVVLKFGSFFGGVWLQKSGGP